MTDNSDLDGATKPPPLNAYPADAGEFAARWNAMRPVRRERWMETLVENAQIAMRLSEAPSAVLAKHDREVAAQALETAAERLKARATDIRSGSEKGKAMSLVTIAEKCVCGASVTVTGGTYRSTAGGGTNGQHRSAEEIVERWRKNHNHRPPLQPGSEGDNQ